MDKHNPDTVATHNQANELDRGLSSVPSKAERTLFGNEVVDDDELKRPAEDRSPLTPGSSEEPTR